MSFHTRSKNGRKCYLELEVNFKTEAHEEIKYSKYSAILQSAHFSINRKFTVNHYYNLVKISFFQLKEAGPVYTLTEAQKISSFKNGLKRHKSINFSITEKVNGTSY